MSARIPINALVIAQIYLASFYAYALREPLVTHTLEMAVLHRMISIQVTIT